MLKAKLGKPEIEGQGAAICTRSSKWGCWEKFGNVHRKATVLESLFNKVAGLKT